MYQSAIRLLLIFAFCTISLLSRADPALPQDRSDVIATVEGFFAAMRSRSATEFETLVLPDAVVHGYSASATGVRLMSMTRDEYISSLQSGEQQLIERMWDVQVLLDDRLAVLWAAYDLYVGGQFSHCGIDAFTLLKTDQGWRISSVGFSTQRSDCPPNPAGEPAD